MDDGIRYLLDLAIILFAAKLFGTVGKKIGIPEVVGEILAGLLVGSAVLGVVKESDFLSKVSEIGVIMLMFEAGLGTNIQELKKFQKKQYNMKLITQYQNSVWKLI